MSKSNSVWDERWRRSCNPRARGQPFGGTPTTASRSGSAALERVEPDVGQIARAPACWRTIGYCPFVGLFGTVWGIMNSFIGIPRRTPPTSPWSPGSRGAARDGAGLIGRSGVVIYNI